MKQINELNDDIHLITHSNCMDGTYSAVILNQYCEMSGKHITIAFKQYDNVNEEELLEKYKNKTLILCDFSYSKDILLKLEEVTNDLIVLDHHETAMENLEGLDFCLFDMNKCGAMLMWEYCYPDKECPDIINYIQDRDLWNWNLPDSREFSAGLQLFKQSDLTHGNPPEDLLNDEFLNDCIDEGKSILAYQKSIIDKKCANKTNFKFFKINNINIPCINSTTLISEIGNELANGLPFSAQYFITETEIVFSLRSIGDEEISNVATIAKKYGGGGHKNAAGFSLTFDKIDLNMFFSTKNLDKSIIKNREFTIENMSNENDLLELKRRCEQYIKTKNIETNVTKELLFWYIMYEPFKDLDIDFRISSNNESIRLATDETYLSYVVDNIISFSDGEFSTIHSFDKTNLLLDKIDTFITKLNSGTLLDLMLEY